MALFDNLFNGGVPGILLGVGVALAAPVLLPAVATGARPLAKVLIRGGVVVADTVREVVAEAGEQLSDLVAEVQAERTNSTAQPRQESGQSRIIMPSDA